MLIHLRDLAATPSHRVRFDYTTDLSKEEVGFEYPFRQPVRLAGEITDAAGAVTLRAVVQAHVTTRCARCGEPVEYDKETPVEFLLVKEIAGQEEQELPDDMLAIRSDELELDEVLIPELILDMEMAVLCREDCKGLCPKCGANLNRGECGCSRREIDPRLAVLQRILEEKKDRKN